MCISLQKCATNWSITPFLNIYLYIRNSVRETFSSLCCCSFVGWHWCSSIFAWVWYYFVVLYDAFLDRQFSRSWCWNVHKKLITHWLNYNRRLKNEEKCPLAFTCTLNFQSLIEFVTGGLFPACCRGRQTERFLTEQRWSAVGTQQRRAANDQIRWLSQTTVTKTK